MPHITSARPRGLRCILKNNLDCLFKLDLESSSPHYLLLLLLLINITISIIIIIIIIMEYGIYITLLIISAPPFKYTCLHLNIICHSAKIVSTTHNENTPLLPTSMKPSEKCAIHNHPCKLCRLLPSASLSNFSPIHDLFFLLFSPSLPLWVVTFMYFLWLVDQPFVILGYTVSNHEWKLALLLLLQWSCSIYLQNDHTIANNIHQSHPQQWCSNHMSY